MSVKHWLIRIGRENYSNRGEKLKDQATAEETTATKEEAEEPAERGNRRSEASGRYKNREQGKLNVVVKKLEEIYATITKK